VDIPWERRCPRQRNSFCLILNRILFLGGDPVKLFPLYLKHGDLWQCSLCDKVYALRRDAYECCLFLKLRKRSVQSMRERKRR